MQIFDNCNQVTTSPKTGAKDTMCLVKLLHFAQNSPILGKTLPLNPTMSKQSNKFTRGKRVCKRLKTIQKYQCHWAWLAHICNSSTLKLRQIDEEFKSIWATGALVEPCLKINKGPQMEFSAKVLDSTPVTKGRGGGKVTEDNQNSKQNRQVIFHITEAV